MNRRFFLITLALLTLLAGSFLTVSAQDDDMMDVPSVEVTDQLSLDGTVVVDSAYSEGPGFIVIHADNGEGGPGPVLGNRWIGPGWSYNIEVAIDTQGATHTLFAMLHADTGEVGVYEFGSVEGADGPVRVDDQVVTPAFNAILVHANDQLVADGTVTVAAVVAEVDGWLVIHSGDAESFGAVVGAAQVAAGTNTDVVVEVTDPTAVVWPMLHVDTGTAGEYEFGTVEGADGPVVVDDEVATFPIWTVPSMRVHDQIVVHGDNYPGEMMMDMAPTVHAESVVSEGPGWLVIHADNDGSPGPVLGAAQVAAGTNLEVAVELSADGLTPVLWPMLHVDTGTEGEYEFGTVEGADGPVRVDDQVVTYAISAAPSYGNLLCEYDGATVWCDALIDAQGWLVIHADADGSPGEVLAVTPLIPGLNYAVLDVDSGGADQVWPMLHYDTGVAGEYEFGTVDGADAPVFVGEAVVTGPLGMGMMEE